ncbi:MAG: hypothetical protein ACF8PN_06790 [Phycisphaerales bacterium]
MPDTLKPNKVEVDAPGRAAWQSGLPLDHLRVAAAILMRAGVRLADNPRAAASEDWHRAFSQGEKLAERDLGSLVAYVGNREGLFGPDRHVTIPVVEQILAHPPAARATSAIFGTVIDFQASRQFDEFRGDSLSGGWVRFGERQSVNRTGERVRLFDTPTFRKLAAGGQADEIQIQAEAETTLGGRFAGRAKIDEQDIADDRIDLLTDAIPRIMARGARRSILDRLFYLLLSNPNTADGNALFSSAHGNTYTNALAVGALQTAIQAMIEQTDTPEATTGTVNVYPRAVVCAAALSTTAREIVNALRIPEDSTDPIQLIVREDGRIGNGVIDPIGGTEQSGSDTAWFLASGDRQARDAAIAVEFREGTNMAPVIVSAPLSSGEWGIEIGAYVDAAVTVLDWRGLVRGNS